MIGYVADKCYVSTVAGNPTTSASGTILSGSLGMARLADHSLLIAESKRIFRLIPTTGMTLNARSRRN